jgi:NAD(P)H-hydrate epimerase
MHEFALLSVAEMAEADRLAVAKGGPWGVASLTLMENAGAGVADAIVREFAPQLVVVLCGPGNNGGDGFVVARKLSQAGWQVRLALLGGKAALTGDAAVMAARWPGAVEPLAPESLAGAGLAVDGIFGAGLSRPVTGAAAATIATVNASGLPVVAIDVPSGIHGDTGEAMGAAIRATRTVTFFRKKPAHLLLPGRLHCGAVSVVDIGIPAAVLERLKPAAWENGPWLWRDRIPWPKPDGHKYDRGHVVVRSGGPAATGAARLAARGALRIGAGLVTVATPPAAVAIVAGALTAAMVAPVASLAQWRKLLADQRKNAVLVGPNNGVTPATRDAALAALRAGKRCVLDADALTVFAANRPGDRKRLFTALAGGVGVLTPHDGEFSRLFDVPGGTAALSVTRGAQSAPGDKLTRTRLAARQSKAVIVLKGADTVIAAPDGRAAINANAPAELATAGAGDVLAGFIAGLLAQGMAPFDAAAAAVWLHGAAASAFGPGLIAEDLSETLPAVLARLRQND